MRVWIGGREAVYPARWFFCDDNAKLFPSAHGAEASPWLKSHEVNESWGEIAGTKTLDRGINPGYTGQCAVGDPQWFIDGKLPANIFTQTPGICVGCGPFTPKPPYVDAALLTALYAQPLFGHFEDGPACFTAAPLFPLFHDLTFFLISNLLNYGTCGFVEGIGVTPTHDECGQKLVARFFAFSSVPPVPQDNCFLIDTGQHYGEAMLSSVQLSPLRLEFKGVKLFAGTLPSQPGVVCPGGTVTFVVTP